MRTLLIIDDNRSVRESLRFLLMRKGYTVFVAESGPQGIALAADTPVDGALVDVNMPGMNGVEACRLLREQAQARGRKLAVWMMTGARTTDLARQAAAVGALCVFSKPFDFGDLFRRFDEELGPVQAPAPQPDVLDEL